MKKRIVAVVIGATLAGVMSMGSPARAAPASASEDCVEVSWHQICFEGDQTCILVGGMPPEVCVDHPPNN